MKKSALFLLILFICSGLPTPLLAAAPTITLVGPSVVNMVVFNPYNDQGATADDAEDGDISADIVTENTVNVFVPGAYSVTYNVDDSEGNPALQVTRMVYVVAGDATDPVITIVGDNPVSHPIGTLYFDAGATALDNIDGDISGDINTINTVVPFAVGTYTVVYDVADTAGNTTVATRTVNVVSPDTTDPVITITGDNPVNHTVGTLYFDAGATALDNIDGDISGDINTTNSVVPFMVGTYTVVYDVADVAGNSSVATRTVNIVNPDTTDPVITITGDNPVNHTVGTLYFDAGATALDNIDGDISGDINTTNSVVPFMVGTYTVVYDVADVAGNSSVATRTVNIVNPDTTDPICSAPLPSGALVANTTNTTLSFTTDEQAFCKYSIIADTDFSLMINDFDLGTTAAHSLAVDSLTNGSSYNYYIRCQDNLGNTNTEDFLINFAVSNPSSSGSSGSSGGSSGGSSYTPPAKNIDGGFDYPVTDISSDRTTEAITISWTNPLDSRFAKTVIIKSSETIDSYMTYNTLLNLAEMVYEDTSDSFTDTEIQKNLDYYYAIFTLDDNNNSSNAVIIEKKSAIIPSEEKKNSDQAGNTSSGNQDYSNLSNLAGVPSEIVEAVSLSDAQTIHQYNRHIILNKTTNRLYLFISVKSPHSLSEQDKFALAYYIHEGSPTTKILGAGERTGVLNSYLNAFSKLPTTETEWQDVIKIANGRWPTQKNQGRENKTENTTFATIYQRAPDMNHPHDNAAVTVITYGLRPADRNLDSEKAAIKIYRNIFNQDPVEAYEWDIVRAIAYSGAIR